MADPAPSPVRWDATRLPACKIISGCQAIVKHQIRPHDTRQAQTRVRDDECGWGPLAPHASRRPVRLLAAHMISSITTDQDRRLPPRPRGEGVAVIIVSELSAKVARQARTWQSTPVRSRSSAAHNDILRYADARPISVHAEVLAWISISSDIPGSSYTASPTSRTPNGVDSHSCRA